MRPPRKPSAEAERRERRRKDVRWALLTLILGALLAGIVVGGVWIVDQLRTANAARDALAAQVQKLGAKPVGGPPGSRGTVGPVGLRGPTGPAGRDGVDGTDGADGSDSTVPGPEGADGQDSNEPGPAGQDGADGSNGADSTTPGPAGKDGIDGKDGRDGADSTVPGPQGPRGDRGPAGPSCPDGYSLQAPAGDPDALVCRRDSAPDPDQNSPAPQAMAALDPSRRTWT